jgi:hypothetical protein
VYINGNFSVVTKLEKWPMFGISEFEVRGGSFLSSYAAPNTII